MSLENVKEYLAGFGMEERILEFDQSSATVELAAEAIGCEPERIAKTIAMDGNEGPILVVASGDQKIDNKKFKETFQQKAKMIPFDKVEEKTGHYAGGVCPFALKEGVKVYLDRSLERFVTVYPACGSSNSVIEMTLEELEKLSGYISWVDVCKSVYNKEASV